MKWIVFVAMGAIGCGDAGTPSDADRHAGAGTGVAPDAGVGADASVGVGADGGADVDSREHADAGPGSDASTCVACDDFERGIVGQPPGGLWTVSTPNCSGVGAIAIDDSQAHHGTRSVKVTGAGGYCNHVFFATPIAMARPTTWIRFFVRFDAALGDGHTTFLAMRDARDGKDLRMGGQNRVLMFNREADDATLPAMSPAGTAKSVAPRIRTWTCVEAAMDSIAKTIRTWVDGAVVDGMVVDGAPTPDVDEAWLRDTAWSPDLVDARFGWESYAGQADTLWFDDVAIGDARFGCGG